MNKEDWEETKFWLFCGTLFLLAIALMAYRVLYGVPCPPDSLC